MSSFRRSSRCATSLSHSLFDRCTYISCTGALSPSSPRRLAHFFFAASLPFFLCQPQLVSGARGKTVYDNGDVNAGVWSASPVMGLIDDIPSCAVLLQRMEKDAEKILVEGASKVIAEGAKSKL